MADAAVAVEDKTTGFVRGLGLLDSTTIVAGSMIGSGIFIVSAAMARQLASPGWLLIAWVVTSVLVVAERMQSGTSLFLVETAARSVRLRPAETIDLTRRVGEVELRDVVVGRDALLGREGDGAGLLARLLDLGAVGIAADSLGGAARALEMAVEYAKVREQFGRKIGSFQAIKHMAAEMAAEVEPTRSLVWYAAYGFDHRLREAPRAAAIAKARLGEVYCRTVERSLQIHGGIGFTWEHDLHLWFKRARWNQVAFGDPTFHRERLATIDGY